MPAWGGLLLGVAMALTMGNPHLARTRALTPKLLAGSVVGLGAAMDLRVVAVVGVQGVGYTLVGITATLCLGVFLGRWLAIRRNTSWLVSIGTAICGGSAIAAAAPVLRADEEDTSLALATVFLLNALALLLFPFIGHALHLSERAFGLWAALAIHDTSSVVGASAMYGNEALMVATTTKLARALWIVPLTLGLGFWVARRESCEAAPVKAPRPWFILGFLVMAALVTLVPVLQPLGLGVAAIAKRSLVLTLFLLGLGLSRASIAKMGPKPILQGLLLWLMVAGATLGAILAGWVR
ncbi:MAG: putative sulfate exporter family transporter [Holophaga sp.]|nr:putative sulfate exporter family transporter [Holophaga sp.]